MTDEEIAIAHMTLWDAETVSGVTLWREHWQKHFSNMANAVHYGDCTKQPCACNLCLAEEAVKMVPVYRELFGLPPSSTAHPSNPATARALSRSSASDDTHQRTDGDGAVAAFGAGGKVEC